MEALTVINAEPRWGSTWEFIHLPTHKPREFRAAAPAPYLKNSYCLKTITCCHQGRLLVNGKIFPSISSYWPTTEGNPGWIESTIEGTDRVTHFFQRVHLSCFLLTTASGMCDGLREKSALIQPWQSIGISKIYFWIRKKKIAFGWLVLITRSPSVEQHLRPLHEFASSAGKMCSHVSERNWPPSNPWVLALRVLVWMIEGLPTNCTIWSSHKTNGRTQGFDYNVYLQKNSRKNPAHCVVGNPISPQKKDCILGSDPSVHGPIRHRIC
jgi:hypothetical protein